MKTLHWALALLLGLAPLGGAAWADGELPVNGNFRGAPSGFSPAPGWTLTADGGQARVLPTTAANDFALELQAPADRSQSALSDMYPLSSNVLKLELYVGGYGALSIGYEAFDANRAALGTAGSKQVKTEGATLKLTQHFNLPANARFARVRLTAEPGSAVHFFGIDARTADVVVTTTTTPDYIVVPAPIVPAPRREYIAVPPPLAHPRAGAVPPPAPAPITSPAPKPVVRNEPPKATPGAKPVVRNEPPKATSGAKPVVRNEPPKAAPAPKPVIRNEPPKAPPAPQPVIRNEPPKATPTAKPVVRNEPPKAPPAPKPVIRNEPPNPTPAPKVPPASLLVPHGNTPPLANPDGPAPVVAPAHP